jgi:predicted metalloendopeptidase
LSSNKVYILIAHEITHAFDDVGIQYDSQGSYKPLYDNETVSRFHNASDCVRRQYSNYTIGNPNGDPSKFFQVDGNITLGENIADHGGLKIAEIAYEKWLATKSDGEQNIVLPALENFRFIYSKFDKTMFYPSILS